jgi:hypothetical protein
MLIQITVVNVMSGRLSTQECRKFPEPVLSLLQQEEHSGAQPPAPLLGERSSALQEKIRVILRKAELEGMSLHGLKSFFPPTFLMFLIMDPFFKHYTPQLAHNCCPCCMNYALRNVNPGSLALDESQAVEEAGVITKIIPGPWGR